MLLRKVEELTLHVIDQQKQIAAQHEKMEEMERTMDALAN
jgi:cell division protein FtsB